jgi:hypothetical protein
VDGLGYFMWTGKDRPSARVGLGHVDGFYKAVWMGWVRSGGRFRLIYVNGLG